MNIVKILREKQLIRTFATGSFFVFSGSMIANVCAYLYHLIIGRILGPVGYGELSSLISILYIFSIPITVLSTFLTKYFSIAKAQNAPGKAKDLFFKTTKYTVWFLGIIFILTLVSAPSISGFLHIDKQYIVLWVFATFAFSILTAISASLLQGFQIFLWYGVFSALTIVLKLVLSVPLSYLGVEWTLIGAVCSSILMYALFFLPIRFILRKKTDRFELTKREAMLFSIPTFLSLLGTTSLYSTDIMLAKHFLSSMDAGIYSAVAILGKIIFYASSALTLVVFPIISEAVVKKKNTSKIILVALTAVSVISIGITTVYYFFPTLILSLLFGSTFLSAAPYIGFFGVFISLFSVGYLVTMVCLALGKTNVSWFAAVCAIGQIAGIWFFHESIASIIWVNLIFGALFAFGVLSYLLLSKRKNI